MDEQDWQALPDFQKMQYRFAARIRDPQGTADASGNVVQKSPGLVETGVDPTLRIEERRWKAYEDLFFNNVQDFFSKLFPVLKSVVGETRWAELVREYLQKHRARTPLFHELGEEFLVFLQQGYDPQPQDPAFMLPLAHYEWVELALSVDEADGFENPPGLTADLDAVYELSPVAWPLAYDWPVHELGPDFMPEAPPEMVTTLLVYRDADDAIQFMVLSPVLYEFIQRLANPDVVEIVERPTARTVLQGLAEALQVPVADLEGFAQSVLQDLIDRQVLRPVV
jgi:hypothetical protein